MKFSRSILLAGAFFGILSNANTADANVIDFVGNSSFVNMGTTSGYQSGIIVDNEYPQTLSIGGFGYIPPASTITFSYSLSGVRNDAPVPPGSLGTPGLYIQSSYDFTLGSDHYNGFNVAGRNIPFNCKVCNGYLNGLPYFQLGLVTANLTETDNGNISTYTGTTSLENISEGYVGFRTEIFGFGLDNLTIAPVQYTVMPAPLPPALPMFVAGILGLFALNRRRSSILS